MINSWNRYMVASTAILALAMACGRTLASGVTVNVSVTTDAGVPLANAPVAVRSPSDAQFAFTDGAGKAAVTLNILPTDDQINAYLYKGTRFDMTPEQRILAAEKYADYTRTFSFQTEYAVDIVPGRAQYDIAMIGHDAIAVTCRVTNQPQFPTQVTAEVRGVASVGMFPPGEPFTLHGVRKGAAAELFFGMEGAVIHSVRLSAQQTLADIDLGDVAIPSPAGTAVVDLTAENFLNQWTRGGMEPLGRYVTLIRADGGLILAYPINRSNGKVVADVDTVQPMVPPSLPPGTYYISPGIFGGRLQLRLLDALRAGQQAALDAHNVPKVTAVADQTVTLTFDAAQARDNIMAATAN